MTDSGADKKALLLRSDWLSNPTVLMRILVSLFQKKPDFSQARNKPLNDQVCWTLASFCVQLWTVKHWTLMHMYMIVEIFMAIMVVNRSEGAIEIERRSAAVDVGNSLGVVRVFCCCCCCCCSHTDWLYRRLVSRSQSVQRNCKDIERSACKQRNLSDFITTAPYFNA